MAAFAQPSASCDASIPTGFVKERTICPANEATVDDLFHCSTEEEDLPYGLHSAEEASVDDSASSGNEESSLIRSVSQAAALAHVEKVLKRVEQFKLDVPALKDDVDMIGVEQEQEASKHLEEKIATVLKRARNLGEDLLEDLLGLDQLTRLLPEDRSSRKQAVMAINSLLEEVDACKASVLQARAALHTPRDAEVANTQKESPLVRAEAVVGLEESLQAPRPNENNDSSDTRVEESIGSSLSDEDSPCELPLACNEVTSEDSSRSCDEQTSTLARSRSQQDACMQVQRVLERLGQFQLAVPELRDEVARLNAEHEKASDEELEQTVASMLKQARNLGEDLAEDVLHLDGLTSLLPEDRNSRKEAVRRLNSLLDEVDACKSIILKAQQALREVCEAQSVEVHDQSRANQSRAGAQQVQPADMPDGNNTRQWDFHSISPPSAKFWETMQVSVDFQQRGAHIVLPASPNLQTNTLKITNNERTRELTVSGLYLPTPQQTERMRQYVANKLERFARTRPREFMRMNERIGEVALELYKELGSHQFGSFSETFQLPMDVDVARVNANVHEGVLSIHLPQRLRREHRASPYFSARHPHSVHPGLSMFDW